MPHGSISPSGRTGERVETGTGACVAGGSRRTGAVADTRDAVIFPVGWTSPSARRIGEAKGRTGDWELDLIIGGMPRGAWISWGDRASKYRVLVWVEGKTAAAVTEAIVRRMGPIRDRVHTGTADNGKEFAGHREIAKALGADLDFATPDHSWERGLNEHTHGRVRQSFPQGTDFRQVTASQVQAVEERINRRPRKVLGVRTPEEVFTAVAPP